MDRVTRVKEEPVAEFEPIPEAMKELHVAGQPPFLTKTYEMVENPETDDVVSWSEARNSFIVWDYIKFSSLLLPKYFKHNNFSSFIRQLNTYGFRKVDPDRYEFANEGFLGGQRHLLRTIARRRHVGLSSQQQQERGAGARGVEGIADELGMLKRQRKMLLMEVLGLKRQQMDVKENMIEMHKRLSRTEREQQQMASFLSRAVSNPLVLEQFLEGCEKRRELGNGVESRRKRRLSGFCSQENLHNVLMSGMRSTVDMNFGSQQHQAEELMNMESELESLFDDLSDEINYSKLDTVWEEDGRDNHCDFLNEAATWEDLPSEELVDWDIDECVDNMHSGDPVAMKIQVEDLVPSIEFESGDDNDVKDLFDQMSYVNRSSL